MLIRILLISIGLSGCTFAVTGPDGDRLADCYSGLYNGFCRVVTPKGTTVVGGSAIVPTAGAGGIVAAGLAAGIVP